LFDQQSTVLLCQQRLFDVQHDLTASANTARLALFGFFIISGNRKMSEPILLALLYDVALTAFVWLNIWYWKRRRAMTPEERKQEDESLSDPGDW
jgi:hypothetical protein